MHHQPRRFQRLHPRRRFRHFSVQISRNVRKRNPLMHLLNTLCRRFFRGLPNRRIPFNCHTSATLVLHSMFRRTSSVEGNCGDCREAISLSFEGSDAAAECASANPNSEDKVSSPNNRIHETGDPVNKNCCSSVEDKDLWAFFGVSEKENFKLVEPTDRANEDPTVIRELSADMQLLAHHLYKEGYLKGATFMPENRFDMKMFELSYAREFLKFAGAKFGKERQCIVKWLSTSDLKKIALFGCPSLEKKSIHAAKHMRNFLGIKEHEVCQKCTLKHSCKLVNRRPRKDSTRLHLASVMRVLVMYALDSVPGRLVVPEEIKDSVSRLLKEIIKLSRAVS